MAKLNEFKYIKLKSKNMFEYIPNVKKPALDEIDKERLGLYHLILEKVTGLSDANEVQEIIQEINISPVALNESEGKFIKDLKEFCNENLANFDNRELYIIRNKSKKGVGFFENSGFYPDFIMWVIDNEKQHIVFIEPHGMRNTAFTDEKVELFCKIKEVETSLNNSNVTLESFIISSTKYVDLPDKTYLEADWNNKHVFFMEDDEYLQKIFEVIK